MNLIFMKLNLNLCFLRLEEIFNAWIFYKLHKNIQKKNVRYIFKETEYLRFLFPIAHNLLS